MTRGHFQYCSEEVKKFKTNIQNDRFYHRVKIIITSQVGFRCPVRGACETRTYPSECLQPSPSACSFRIYRIPGDGTILPAIQAIELFHIPLVQLKIVELGVGVDTGGGSTFWERNEAGEKQEQHGIETGREYQDKRESHPC